MSLWDAGGSVRPIPPSVPPPGATARRPTVHSGTNALPGSLARVLTSPVGNRGFLFKQLHDTGLHLHG